jgi:hypothetical protein
VPGVRGSSSSLRTRFYGEPPGPDAAPIERVLYVRRILVRLLLVALPLYLAAALAIATSTTWAALGVVTLLQLFTIAWISRDIRRRRSERETTF